MAVSTGWLDVSVSSVGSSASPECEESRLARVSSSCEWEMAGPISVGSTMPSDQFIVASVGESLLSVDFGQRSRRT